MEELSIKALTLWKMTRGDVVVQVSDNVWNNQNQKHAEFKDAEALFKRSEFTVLVDLKRTEPSASSDQDKRALLSIGTETNNLHVFTLSGKLGYGDTVKGGGISAHQVALSEKVTGQVQPLSTRKQREAMGRSMST